MAARTVVLIPPSEGKAAGGQGEPWHPGSMAVAELDRARARVLRALGRRSGPAVAPTMAAAERYTGVLYRELDPASLRGTARRRFQRDVLVASGLWGLVAPTDPIPDYRLKMGARLEPLGKLSTWWRPQITAALAPRVAGAVVWDLLPAEHAAAVDWSGLAPKRRATVTFLDRNDRTVSHWNKLLKGSIVRWLAESGARDPHDLADFEHPQGYVLDPAATVVDGVHTSLVLRQRA